MHKRDFLKLLGAIILGTASTACTRASSQNTSMPANKKRIVVIGAGLSGLAAARTLQQQGHDVIVVEARDRIGGRIWTSHKWSDMPLDLGASWIHGVNGNPLTQLADEIHTPRIITRYDSAATYNTNGQPLTQTENQHLDDLRQQIYKALQQAQDQDTDVSIKQVIEPLLGKFDPSSEAYRFISFIVNSEIEQEYSGSIANISAQWYDNDKQFGGDDVLFAQGFNVITSYLADKLRIELGQTVQAIDWSQSLIQVVTQKTTFVADQVLVTIPLGVLQAKKIRFNPALPEQKQTAITTLGMGVLNKCYLRFENAFWSKDVDWLEYISAPRGEWTEWVSFKRAANLPVLLGFNAADRGKEIEAWSDQDIVASAMRTLKIIYGADIPQPIDYQVTRWATDPFSLGSYSYNPVGVAADTRNILAAPIKQQLFFAGEASEQYYFGTAHGAYLSGLRAANEILSI